ncbi:uncharacterized protein ISCGN_015382, partial [Ixodes scapularis]
VWSRAGLLLLGRRPFLTWCQKLANTVTMAEGDLHIQVVCVGASGLHPLAPFTFTSPAEWPTWIATRTVRTTSAITAKPSELQGKRCRKHVTTGKQPQSPAYFKSSDPLEVGGGRVG